MYRERMETLKEWKVSKTRKPLIIRGARQVGKTWLMKEFGKLYYEKCAYINFDDNTRMNKLFDEDFDLDRIIQGLKIESGVNIEPENTLIILDEIQETPNALKALKYFYENANEYHIVAAGSLLGVAMHQGTSFPVGKVNFMDLMPLSFFEFLNALGQEHLLNLLKNNEFDMISVFNNKYKDYLKLYYYIGGMPEVVNSYVEEKDLAEVRNIQKTLLKDYEQARAREYEIALSWLIDCGLIYQVNRVNNCKVPLSAYQDFNAFKLYLLDVGLLAAMSDLDSKTILEGNDIFEEFKGSLTEQYVLCQLKECTELNVFYWSSEKGIAEIDFIVQIGKNNVPIEVKSNENLQAKSLKSFVEKYNTKINVRTSMANFREEEWLTNIPLYSIGNIEKTIK